MVTSSSLARECLQYNRVIWCLPQDNCFWGHEQTVIVNRLVQPGDESFVQPMLNRALTPHNASFRLSSLRLRAISNLVGDFTTFRTRLSAVPAELAHCLFGEFLNLHSLQHLENEVFDD